MSNSKEHLEEIYERAGVPIELFPSWVGKLICDWGCRHCQGRRFGCKTSSREQNRRWMNEWANQRNAIFEPNFKRNLSTLYFIWCVGNMHFRSYGMRMDKISMTKIQVALMDVALRQKRIKYYTDEICIIPVQMQLQCYVNNIFRGYKLSKDQTSLICDWSEKVFPFVPMDAVKKIIMTSIALSFLINRIVQNGDKRLVLFMFHSVFKQTLVRRKFPRTTISWQKCMHDRDFLNAIFKN